LGEGHRERKKATLLLKISVLSLILKAWSTTENAVDALFPLIHAFNHRKTKRMPYLF
jgi:hypothetical protein